MPTSAEQMPVPKKNSAIMLRRLHLSASQPAGSANRPNAVKAAVESTSSSP